MLDYDNMIKALRLSWLKRIVDPDYSGFWKLYLNYLLQNEGGLFLIQCNYEINQVTLPTTFYRELLEWWAKVREIEDPDNTYKYVLWNNKEIKIDGKSVFYRHFFEIQLTIKISEIRLRRFGIILTPLSSRNKDNGRVSNLNTNKGDRVC